MGVLIYVLAATCLVAGTHSQTLEEEWRVIDSAGLQRNKYLYLYSGNKLMTLEDGIFKQTYNKGGWVPPDFAVTAYVITLSHESKYLIYGETSGYFVDQSAGLKKRKFRYGPRRAALKNGGPDAAFRRDGKIYVLKGCQMIQRKRWDSWGAPEDVSASVGLPCDVHAAWQDVDGATNILKGPQFWRWALNGTISGPFAFVRYYRMGRWD